LGAEHPDTALSAHNLGVQLDRTGGAGAALELLYEAESVFSAAYPHDHPRLERTRAAIAKLAAQGAPTTPRST
jgi:hypothetical protein